MYDKKKEKWNILSFRKGMLNKPLFSLQLSLLTAVLAPVRHGHKLFALVQVLSEDFTGALVKLWKFMTMKNLKLHYNSKVAKVLIQRSIKPSKSLSFLILCQAVFSYILSSRDNNINLCKWLEVEMLVHLINVVTFEI